MEKEREHLEALVKIRLLELELEHIRDDVDDLNKTVYNDGKGIVYDVVQLKHDRTSAAARWSAIIATLAVLISLASVLIQIFG